MAIQTYQAHLPHSEYPLSSQHLDTIHGPALYLTVQELRRAEHARQAARSFIFLLIRTLRKFMLPPSPLPHKLVDNLWVRGGGGIGFTF